MEQKLLSVFQQSELDAVRMYQALAAGTANEDERKLLLQLGAVEGRHAAILRGLTGKTDLKPPDAMAKPMLLLDKYLGRKGTYVLLSLGEHGAYFLYQPLAAKYAALKQVATDERNHGTTLFRLVAAKVRARPIPAMAQ